MTIKIAAALEVARGKKVRITFKPNNPTLPQVLRQLLSMRNQGLINIDPDDHVFVLSVINDGAWPTNHRSITLDVSEELDPALFTQKMSHALADIEVVA